jgi:exopolysaccharide biosynthesis protein
MLPKLKHPKSFIRRHAFAILFILLLLLLPPGAVAFQNLNRQIFELSTDKQRLESDLATTKKLLSEAEAQIEVLKNEDLRKTNQQVREEIANLKATYTRAYNTYKEVLSIRDRAGRFGPLESIFATILNNLAKDDLKSAETNLKKLADDIAKEDARLATVVTIAANVPEIQAAPGSGYRRQKVVIDGNAYQVDVIAADLASTRVIVDTASDSTCRQDCPVLPLATYVSRSGAYAGVNGTYFCPETYPECADRKNTFDYLVMNKNKVYFNSDMNVYSNVPAVIFSGSSVRYVGQALEWGRDTGADAVISNRPLLVLGKNISLGATEAKENIKGNRSFVGNTGSTAYIGVVRSATLAEAAKVLQAMGVENALNLDNGGSTALWSGGYKIGPGRNLPNVILFVRK